MPRPAVHSYRDTHAARDSLEKVPRVGPGGRQEGGMQDDRELMPQGRRRHSLANKYRDIFPFFVYFYFVHGDDDGGPGGAAGGGSGGTVGGGGEPVVLVVINLGVDST